MNSERELLFGVLSVQLGFANAHTVMTLAVDWVGVRVPGRRFEDFLVEQGALKPVHRAMVDGVVNEVMADGAKFETLVTMNRGGTVFEEMISTETELRTEPPDGGSLDSLGDAERVLLEARGRYEYATGENGNPLVLGKGGIGQVLVVKDRFLGREVALKELLVSEPSLATEDVTARSTAVEARFLREARVTGQLEHPAIVPVYELGRHREGGTYYTMPRIRGSTLHEAIKKADTLADRLLLLPHFVAACQGLAYAHSRNVVHRDVKPQNVMIGAFGETYVLDWGLARIKGRADPRASDMRMAPDITGNMLRGAAIGTPAYMAPEQASGNIDQIDERSDVWGLGAMLYELLCGRPPYSGQTPLEVVAKILKDPVPPVRSRQAAVPAELATICDRALQKDPQRRYPTAAALKEDIEAYMAGRRVSAHTYSSWQLAGRFMKQNRISLSVLGAMLVFLAVWFSVLVAKVRAERDDAKQFADLFLEDVTTRLSPVPGAAPLVEQLASRALAHYRKMVDPKRAPLDERRQLSKAYWRIGTISQQVGRTPEALQSFRYAREIAEGVAIDSNHDVASRRLLADALVGEFDAASAISGTADEWPRLLQARDEIEKAGADAPADVKVLDTTSRVYSRMGVTYLTKGERAIGLPWLTRAMQTDERIVALGPDDALARWGLATTTLQVASTEEDEGRFDAADTLYRKSLGLAEDLNHKEPANSRFQLLLANTRRQLASLLRRRGDEAAAAPLLKSSTSALVALTAADPGVYEYRAALVLTLFEAGEVEALGKAGAALAAITSGADVALLLMLASFSNGDWAAVERHVVSGYLQKPATRHVFGIASAALRGDRAEALSRARAARQARLDELPDWSRGRLEPKKPDPTPEAAAGRKFIAGVDQAYAQADPEALRLAIERFERALLELPAPH